MQEIMKLNLKYGWTYVGFALIAVGMESPIFSDIKLCNLLTVNQCFRGTRQCYIPQDSTLQGLS
jgi:hypothetical protein